MEQIPGHLEMNMPSRPRIVAVIGMHRSGTSAMTRALGFAGVTLGSDLIETMPEVNAKGFWEDATLNALNIEVLRVFGMDWLSNRAIEETRFDEDAIVLIAERAASILREKAASSAVFAFKDPRTSILLPFWQRVFRLAGVEGSYLIAVRHPSSVAASLYARNGFERIKSELLWLRYTLESITRTEGAPRVLVDYDVLIDRPVEELRRIASALSLGMPLPEAEIEFANSFLSRELRHNFHEIDNAAIASAGALYSVLRTLAQNGDNLDSQAINGPLASASRFLGDVSPLLDYLDLLERVATWAPAGADCNLPCLTTLRASYGSLDGSHSKQGITKEADHSWFSRLTRLFG